jgi:hypothetical protein
MARKKRVILEVLTKRKLVEVSLHLGFRSWQVLSKGEIVKRLSRQRKKPMEEILDLLKINELRHICIKLNLNSGGVKKQTIIDRIIGNESSNKSKKIIPPKTNQPINKPTKSSPQPKPSVELKEIEKKNKRIKNMGRDNNVAVAEFEKRPKSSFVKSNNFQEKANFVWQVADDILRGTFKRHEYGDVTLPFVVLRRLDCVLEDKKDAVIKTYKQFKDKIPDPSPVIYKATNGLNFYNTSFYDLRRLAQDAGNIELNFNNYINGYSKNVREIIDNFQIDKIVTKLSKNDLLFMMVDKFTEIDFHPNLVANHEMGYIFEELLRRFSEMSNETAGEHYTPREVIRLMVKPPVC